jgi:lipase
MTTVTRGFLLSGRAQPSEREAATGAVHGVTRRPDCGYLQVTSGLVAGLRLHTRVFGAPGGRTVVALHGVKGHCGRWRLLAGHLPGTRMYALDLRGHGRSGWSPPWTLEQHLADVLATMDDLGLPRADLVGHSFGGAVAVHLARQAPHRVGRIVLLDPAIGLEPVVAGQRAEAERAPRSFADPDEARATRLGTWPPLADESVLDDEVADHLVRDSDGRWRWRYAPAAVVTAYSEMARPAVLPPAGVPTLLVRAARVQVVRPELVAACRAATDAGVTVVDLDCFHEVPLERPELVAELVERFLTT